MTNKPAADNQIKIFDRAQLRHNRDQAVKTYDAHNFLIQEVADRLYDKYLDINRNFNRIVDLGCHGGEMAGRIADKNVVQQDLSLGMVQQARGLRVQADEEALPYQPGSLDLVLSNLSLHWINDLPGCLYQIKHSLKPDGLFLGSLFGGETLTELRQCLTKAEVNLRGGLSPRVSPFMTVQDAGGLLQRAGFSLPVVDTDRITVTYENAFKLMQELKAMGEANILIKRFQGLSSRAVMMEAARLYQEKFVDDRGRIVVTFDIIYLMGWSPHESQQKPLKPGQGKVNLADMFGEKS
ncbi:methyltransferase domain-containing protein [Paremcibacter congregatus]|uniref:SAM-dependent methyltransferase n=1 Tax=Paremcibacter congregatus TaxID=2043170 RepID=A0A2G4YPM3_9PROT|nr:methyltransferase domain-containing protein [Paremcibacter congregatus]PHZ84269.1 SAM-dependent methyltransferase [Paremcibacter congregatus]QDE28996.1 methyltransferase domain-containing protein [Paremcibacter congregatus]|tara:strand:+ start:248 stop:1132 length:885 start_codon:yes stop_codon:yes gene_type:complete